MSDAGFLSEQEPQVTAPELQPPLAPPSQGGEAVAVTVEAPVAPVQVAEVPALEIPVAPVGPDLGEDADALAERQAMQQMQEGQETFLEMGPDGVTEIPADTVPLELSGSQSASASPVVIPKDDVTIEVEKILEQGLQKYFQTMPEPAQVRFRQKGVEVADKIAHMVRSFHITIKTVLRLIRDWLMTIPGVNKFFLEQEAKIKTDQILELEHVRRETVQNSVTEK